MVFPESDYNSSAFGFSNGQYTFSHGAFGADSFRYSVNFGYNWTEWKFWEDTTFIDASVFEGPEYFWQGQHIMVQCEYRLAIIRAYTEQFPKIGVNLRNPPPPSFTLIAVTANHVAYRNFSPVDHSMLGALTRGSRR